MGGGRPLVANLQSCRPSKSREQLSNEAATTKGERLMTKVTPFLMFNDQLEAAMEFYTATFPDSEIRNVARTGKDGPITSAEFLVGGQVFMGYNGARTSRSPKASRSTLTVRTRPKSTS